MASDEPLVEGNVDPPTPDAPAVPEGALLIHGRYQTTWPEGGGRLGLFRHLRLAWKRWRFERTT